MMNDGCNIIGIVVSNIMVFIRSINLVINNIIYIGIVVCKYVVYIVGSCRYICVGKCFLYLI